MTIPAKYEDGVFKPLENVSIEEGTRVEVYVPGERVTERKRPSLRELGFAGMWAYRDDIKSGIEYEDELRDHPRGDAEDSSTS